MKYRTDYIKLVGKVRGTIWMPAIECESDFSVTFSRNEHEAFRRHWTGIRDAVLHVTNDGNYQNCGLDHGFLIIKRVSENGSYTHFREIELTPNIKEIEDLFAK